MQTPDVQELHHSYTSAMNDEEVLFFVMRLSYSQVKPDELMGLQTCDLKKVVEYIKQRKGLYLDRYISAQFATRMKLESESTCPQRIYSEREILTELGCSE